VQLRWLEDFVELAHTRSFTRAAENRSITHPAFGRRIRALEEWVGTRLIGRSQPLELTAAGRLFLESANNALDILYGARTQLQDTAPTLRNNLRIATGRTLASTFFPDWYQDIARRFGAFKAVVSTSGAEEAILRLVANEADLLIAYSSTQTRLLIDQNEFDCLPVAREEIVPVCALNAQGRPLFASTGGAEPMPWLTFARSLALRTALARHLAELPNAPVLRPVYQSDSYESIMAMAKRGIGVAWLPRRLVQEAMDRGEMAAVGDHSWQVSVDIALYRRHNHAHRLLDLIWSRPAAD
jgi:DNA-binding transcriptional LysR family regulator